MGFFDIFRRKPKNKVQEIAPQTRTEPRRRENQDLINYSYTEDGRLVVELHETVPERGQFYDTTRLVIDNRQVDLAGNLVQNCMVSWFGEDDAVYLDDSGDECGRRVQYKNILAGIDRDLLLNDENYCKSVMKHLLNQRRIEEYLNKGEQDNPDVPCGKYVGGIEQTSEGYEKMFYRNLGKASHYSREMCNKRQIIKEEIRRSRESVRAKKQAQIARLQQELEDDDMWR